MKKMLLLVILSMIVFSSLAAQVNGFLLEENDRRILQIWGTHFERGFAHGYLLGDEIRLLYEDYILNGLLMGQISWYNQMRAEYETCFEVSQQFSDEMNGMLEGMIEAGVGLYMEPFGRELDVTDIGVVSALIDLVIDFRNPQENQWCSSLSSFGEATQDDPLLDGNTIITRLLDWQPNPVLLQHHLMIVHLPAEEDEQPWVSFTFPGFIGALSGINGSVCAFLNMGNHNEHNDEGPYHAVLLSIREGLEMADFDTSGDHDGFDVLAAIEAYSRRSGTIVHVTSNQGAQSPQAMVIENNDANGVAVRTSADNTVVQGDNLAATNHFRVLYNPTYCGRYNDIVDSLNAEATMNPHRSWDVLMDAAGVSTSIQAIQFNHQRGEILWSVALQGSPAWQNDPVHYLYEDLLLPFVESDDETAPAGGCFLRVAPNPFNPSTMIRWNQPSTAPVQLEVFNVLGQRVSILFEGTKEKGEHSITWNASGLSSGVYLISIESTGITGGRQIRKTVLLK